MKTRELVIIGCVGLLALGSAVAFAQSAQPEEATEVQSVAEEPPAAPPPSSPATPPNNAPQAIAGNDVVEDAPIEMPAATQSDWSPDINLDAQNQADALSSTPQRKAKPRKILSDAGENPLGTNSWSAGVNSEAAQAALLARSNRRERAIDPLKRSELTKLARVMGALHALRVSCSGRDDQTYRSRMATMLDLEAPDSGELRDPLVDAFNGGFQVYGRGASACPTDARTQEAALAKDGFVLARSMSARYRPVPKTVAVLPPATQPRKNPTAVTETKPSAKAATAPAVTVPAATAPARASWGSATSN